MSHYYITPEQYEIAEKNGISARNVYQRVYSYGMSIEEAITKPVKKYRNRWKQFKEIAESNGICYKTFTSRVYNYGWVPMIAATTSVMSKQDAMDRANDKTRLFTKEQIQQAEKIGVSSQTLWQRVAVRKWDIERAISTPLQPSGRKKKKIS